MEILIGCLYFAQLTGSEVYYYEVAKTLAKTGHRVTVASTDINGQLAGMARELGIEVCHIDDGIPDKPYEAVFVSHKPVVERVLEERLKSSNWRESRVVSINHHEFYPVERPVSDGGIFHYVAIRPAILDMMVSECGIPRDMITLVWNPFDTTKFDMSRRARTNRFNVNPNRLPYRRDEPFRVLFCGTVDYVRKAAIYDVCRSARTMGDTVRLVGMNTADYLGSLLEEFKGTVSWIPQTWDVQELVLDSDVTAGVFVGRTTIEGWLCGIPGIVYEMNEDLTIRSVDFHDVPADLSVFDENNVVKQLLECAGL